MTKQRVDVRGGLPRTGGRLAGPRVLLERERGYPFTVDERTDLAGIPLLTSPVVPDGQALLSVDPGTGSSVVLVGEHDEQAAAVIAAELVACTLGARRRPELLTTPQDRVRDAFRRMAERVRESMGHLAIRLPSKTEATR